MRAWASSTFVVSFKATHPGVHIPHLFQPLHCSGIITHHGRPFQGHQTAMPCTPACDTLPLWRAHQTELQQT